MKFISVPNSYEALSRLDRDESLPGDLEELALDNRSVDFLFSSGVAEAINKSLGIMIDLYEDERVTEKGELEKMLDILKLARATTPDPLLDELVRLSEYAIKKGTGVFFYL